MTAQSAGDAVRDVDLDDRPLGGRHAGPRGPRRRVLLLTAAVVAVAVVVGLVVAGRDDRPSSTATPVEPPPAVWLSGAAGDGVVEGDFGAWRGRDVDIAGTWADDDEAQTALWTLQPGAALADWNKPLDIAVGAISAEETWAEAAEGAYDDRWRESLENLRDLWSGRDGTLYIRFAHEMNGNWYPWSVGPDEVDAFVASWGRFRALQQEIFPESQLVFCVNRETVGSSLDWRELFPGADEVDVMGVDYYNQHPYVGTDREWQDAVEQVDGAGAPKGLQAHLDFARSAGLPLAVPEWSGNADGGDSTAFIEGMHDFFQTHAGSDAGELLYEIQFNVDTDDSNWLLFGNTRMPLSADAYRRLF